MGTVRNMDRLCRELGSQYSVKVIDMEPVIYRDFLNGYDVEISGLYQKSKRARSNVYLWKDGRQIVRTLYGVEQAELGQKVEELRQAVGGM